MIVTAIKVFNLSWKRGMELIWCTKGKRLGTRLACSLLVSDLDGLRFIRHLNLPSLKNLKELEVDPFTMSVW
jgi:hypothetical protein